jgi:hypothetical protein
VRRTLPSACYQMEGFGGPAQPSPTIAQCLNGGYGWLEVMCKRCQTRVSLPLDAIRRPRNTPIWKLEAALKCRSCRTRSSLGRTRLTNGIRTVAGAKGVAPVSPDPTFAEKESPAWAP